jgi:SprT-like family
LDLLRARRVAIELMTEHGIHPEWDFKFDNSRMRHGQARETIVHKKPVKQITASKPITQLSSEEGFRDTILHEIAHVLVGLENGHNDTWHAKALEIGSTGKEFTPEELGHVATLARYHWVCTDGYHPVRYSNRELTAGSFVCKEHPEAKIEMVDMTKVA